MGDHKYFKAFDSSVFANGCDKSSHGPNSEGKHLNHLKSTDLQAVLAKPYWRPLLGLYVNGMRSSPTLCHVRRANNDNKWPCR